MSRRLRIDTGGLVYHVLNRRVGRMTLFKKDEDYEAFEKVLDEAYKIVPMRVLAYCLMPNHFHLVLWPHNDGDLGRWMQWLLTAHVRRYHSRRGTSGHVWQGRFKAFPIQQDEHLLTVLRYVERNPLRARLVRRAEAWRWSSLRSAKHRPAFLADWPVACPRNWIRRVNQAETAAELESVQHSVTRGTPFGNVSWSRRTASRLGLESSLRPRGRPRKRSKK